MLLVHGSPRKMNEYLFEDRAAFELSAPGPDIEGRRHRVRAHARPVTKDVDGVLFVNVGSVGKPKDGDPRACYAVLEYTSQHPVTFRRVEYHVQSAAEAVRQSGLPDKFARDLELGGAK